jgi:uncharacterized coiled-coil DUF342 family protein
MDQKFSKIFDKKTLESISKYCGTNNILDVDKFVFKCFKQGFDIERYGFLGESNQTEVREVEVIKEVPTPPTEVEVIKYVDREVIKEIKVEVPVEKIVYIYDKKTENELDESITKMKEEMSKKDEQLDELRRNLDIFKETPKENTEETKMLQETLQKLRKEINDKNKQIQELEKINKDLTDESSKKIAVYLRGSNINQKI